MRVLSQSETVRKGYYHKELLTSKMILMVFFLFFPPACLRSIKKLSGTIFFKKVAGDRYINVKYWTVSCCKIGQGVGFNDLLTSLPTLTSMNLGQFLTLYPFFSSQRPASSLFQFVRCQWELWEGNGDKKIPQCSVQEHESGVFRCFLCAHLPGICPPQGPMIGLQVYNGFPTFKRNFCH